MDGKREEDPATSGGGAAADRLTELAERLEAFAAERDWEQFHTPKNLAMALAGEAGEVLAEFQWLTPDESIAVMSHDPARAARIRSELADVTNYLVRLAAVLDVDLVSAAHEKLDEVGRRIPPSASTSRTK
ncbi:nucleotide pyrophosphohydrolase [Actinobacteria bacterium YIM 96077]|uniref:Nucleotide pyrophosphohydrolase n=1 Tax=Phytoactinopolyspora halophila TaxID=1981511 RepID=A0A329QUZ5_9ACTN|nr:nucleotide pyrophosphohydrolase [Phytoactinopolyspora halophila]AYY14962.1 nucleotide pyrophosphohydrolase [Actinobacteria bacterium YIM 96077]RAW15419.1 nucleotide pyrophosphohydrolase [Phytoactinopolyspora halophila]